MICSSPTNDKTDWTFSRENEGLKWNLGQFWRSSPVQSKWWKLGWYFAKRKYVDVFLVLFREQRGVFFQITDFRFRIRIYGTIFKRKINFVYKIKVLQYNILRQFFPLVASILPFLVNFPGFFFLVDSLSNFAIFWIFSIICLLSVIIKSKIHNGKSGTIKSCENSLMSLAPLLKIQILSISQGIFKSHFDGI